MKVRFVSQPFADGYDLRDFLEAATTGAGFENLEMVVAWAKRSGLGPMADRIARFRKRGGRVRLVIGISEGGATVQGLNLALQLANEAFVVHDLSGRTFHPKVYLATGTSRALLLVGSHNLTRGGLFTNYEAGILFDLDRTDPGDETIIGEIKNYVERLLADPQSCVKLNEGVIVNLCTDPAYRMGDEDLGRATPPPEADPGDRDGVTDALKTPTGSIFGRSRHPKRKGPKSARRPTRKPLEEGPTPPPSDLPPKGVANAVEKRWFKKLSRADAQRPRPGTNPTGHLSLVKARHPIDRTRFFRYDLFGRVRWTRGKEEREEATIRFMFFIDGETRGEFDLKISHVPAFEAGQGNRTTVLHWGPLGDELRRHSFVGKFVTIERLTNGNFDLRLGEQPAGPFLA